MSFLKAKTHFEQALARAQVNQDKAVEESISEGLLELTRALRSELDGIADRIKRVEQQVSRIR